MFEPLVSSSFSTLQHTHMIILHSCAPLSRSAYTQYTYIFIIYGCEAHSMLPCKMAGIFHTNEISVHSIGKKEQRMYIEKVFAEKRSIQGGKFSSSFPCWFLFRELTSKKEWESWGGRCSIRWGSALLVSLSFFLYLSAFNFLLAFTCTSYKIIRSLF